MVNTCAECIEDPMLNCVFDTQEYRCRFVEEAIVTGISLGRFSM